MEWVWDDEKNRINKRNHGLSFETAILVFDDPFAASRLDPHPDGDRWQTLGMIATQVCSLFTHGPSQTRSQVSRLAGS